MSANVSVILLFTFIVVQTLHSQEDETSLNNPVELGQVHWMRDYDHACSRSEQTGKPILILFQEVPGCANCTTYGRHVLSHPFITEMIETHFIPLAIYNNKDGHDREILRKYKEPAWNNPVIRVVHHNGTDLVPRLSGDFSRAGLVAMIQGALALSGQTIPEYISIWKKELEGAAHSEVAYLSMYCFWTGEKVIAKIPGVLTTEAGFMFRKEVVKVSYNSEATNINKIVLAAKKANCADEVFMKNAVQSKIVNREPGKYRVDKEDKYYLRHSPYKLIPMTPLQSSMVNAAIGANKSPDQYLSARQVELLRLTHARRKEKVEAYAEFGIVPVEGSW